MSDPITKARVQLHCKELKRYKLRYDFYDSHGLAVGNEYHLDELGDMAGKYTWRIIKVFDPEDLP